MLRALILLTALGVAACDHDKPPPAAPHDSDAPVAATPIIPVQQEPLKPQ